MHLFKHLELTRSIFYLVHHSLSNRVPSNTQIMTQSADFQFSRALTGHQLDVRAVCAVNSLNAVASASRDQTAKLWSAVNGDLLVDFQGAHSHFVSCCCFLPPVPNQFPRGALITAGSDKQILIWDLAVIQSQLESREGQGPIVVKEPARVLLGHTDTVSDLAVFIAEDQSQFWVVSSSWDKTARVWSSQQQFQCVRELKGHTFAVWAVLALSDQSILTAAADKTMKLWQGEKCMHTFTDHTDVVRSLALIDKDRFVSCSNDGSVRIWSLGSKSCLQTLYGHTSFVYSVRVLHHQDGFELVSSGEDSSVRIWKDDHCIQTILHPAISIWSACVLANGDVVSGASDHIIRIFSRASDRVAAPAELHVYQQSVEQLTVAAQTMGGVDPKQVKDMSALSQPGKDQQVIMVRTPQNTVEAHQYSAAQGQWIKLGEVVSSVQNKQKQIFMGKEWDYVFDVEIQAGQYLKLPFNANENPYAGAQRFIDMNELPQDFLDQIAQFLVKNTEAVNIGGPSVQNGVSGFQNMDPFTGSQASAPSSKTADKIIPMKPSEWLSFDGGNTAGMMKAITENGKNSPGLWNETVDAVILESILKTNASQKVSNEACELLKKLVLQWTAQNRFPCIDLYRYLISAPGPRSEQLAALFSPTDLLKAGFLSSFDAQEAKSLPPKTLDIVRMLTLKVLTNLLAYGGDVVRSAIYKTAVPNLNVDSFISQTASTNLRLACASFVLNLCLYSGRKQEEAHATQLLAAAHVLLQSTPNTEEEVILRTVIGQAHLFHYFRQQLQRPDDWAVTVVRVSELGSPRAKILAGELQTL